MSYFNIVSFILSGIRSRKIKRNCKQLYLEFTFCRLYYMYPNRSTSRVCRAARSNVWFSSTIGDKQKEGNPLNLLRLEERSITQLKAFLIFVSMVRSTVRILRLESSSSFLCFPPLIVTSKQFFWGS